MIVVPLVVVGSPKGGAGATSAGLGMSAMAGGGPDALFVEADPLGGDLQLHFGLPASPGLVSFAAAARRSGISGGLMREHALALPGGARVIAAPAATEQASGAVELLDPQWREAELDDALVFADVGCLARPVGNDGLLDRADVVVLVCLGGTAQLTHAADVAARLARPGRPLVLAVRGVCGYAPDRLAAQLAVSGCVPLPEDPGDAGLLRGAAAFAPRRRSWRRGEHALMTALAGLRATVLAHVPVPATAEDADGRQVDSQAPSEDPLDRAMSALGR